MELVTFLLLGLLLLIGLCAAPALALMPQLALRPHWTNCVPLISLLFLALASRLLMAFSLFNQTLLLGLVSLCIAAAPARLWLTFNKHKPEWGPSAGWLMLLNAGLVLPIAASLMFGAFLKEDGLSSWNYWALFYYFQETSQNAAGAALYPQLYPLILAMGYKLMGTINIQGPVRFVLALFPFMTLNAIAFSSRQDKVRLLLYIPIAVIVLLPQTDLLKAFNFYGWGYADPLMTAAYICSLAAFIHYVRSGRLIDLWLFTAAGVMASLIKQPGLWLSCVAGPLMMGVHSYWRGRLMKQEIIAVLCLMVPGLVWVLASHTAFYHNYGVINRSLNGSGIDAWVMIRTLLDSCYQYLLKQPQLLLLAGAAFFSCRGDQYLKLVMAVSLIPTWLLWFIFGSYHFRLGLHVVGQWGLITAASGYYLLQHGSSTRRTLKNASVTVAACCLSLALVLSYTVYLSPRKLHRDWQIKHFHPFDSYHLVLHRNFGQGSRYIRQKIFDNPHAAVWAGNKVIAGMMKGHARIVNSGDSPQSILKALETHDVDYVFDAGSTGQAADRALRALVSSCPRGFEQIPLRGARHGFKLYRYRPGQCTINPAFNERGRDGQQ